MNNEKVRSSKTAGILALFFGSFGVHNFYLGEKKKGFGHIAIAVVEIGLIISWFVINYSVRQEIMHSSFTQRAAMLDKATTADTILSIIRIAAWAVGLANEVWAIVELVQIANEGGAGIERRGFKSAEPVATAAQPFTPAQPGQPVQPGQPIQPAAPAQPESQEQQPNNTPGMIVG